MSEFDIEEYMAGLEGLTIQEKVQELENLCDELEYALEDDALEEVQQAMESLIDDYEKSVNDPLKESVSELINQKHWEELVTIKKILFNDYFFVNSKPTSVRISTLWNQDQWVIIINNNEFIASNPKRYETYANLAKRLNLPYQQGKEDIRVQVEENELQPTVIWIITTLCE